MLRSDSGMTEPLDDNAGTEQQQPVQSTSGSRLPSNIQRAEAPMYACAMSKLDGVDARQSDVPISHVLTNLRRLLRETNNSIKGTYLVNVSENKSAPDVVVENSNGGTSLTLYFDGNVPRPLGIKVTATNGQVKLSFPEKRLDQTMHIECATINGEHFGVPAPTGLVMRR